MQNGLIFSQNRLLVETLYVLDDHLVENPKNVEEIHADFKHTVMRTAIPFDDLFYWNMIS